MWLWIVTATMSGLRMELQKAKAYVAERPGACLPIIDGFFVDV
jgi:hypothetical protein